jgi:hypothetical protein
MAPQHLSKSVLIQDGSQHFLKACISDGKIIYCQACQQEAPSSQFFLLNQHNNTAKHVQNNERISARKTKKQPFLKHAAPYPFAAVQILHVFLANYLIIFIWPQILVHCSNLRQ